MGIHCHSRRLLSPFQGTLHVVSVAHGDAETTDGVHWILYVAHEDIVAHTGLCEVRYGTWRADRGLRRAAVRGTVRLDLIEEVGSSLVEALARCAPALPFPLEDRCECWLLEAETGRPLALLGSAEDLPGGAAPVNPRWHPGQGAIRGFSSAHGNAGGLVALVNAAAGRRPGVLWVRRANSGEGQVLDGSRLPAALFPDLLLQQTWLSEGSAALVADFHRWQAPWLLQLPGLHEATRARLETAAWGRPVQTARVYRLFPRVLDRQGDPGEGKADARRSLRRRTTGAFPALCQRVTATPPPRSAASRLELPAAGSRRRPAGRAATG